MEHLEGIEVDGPIAAPSTQGNKRQTSFETPEPSNMMDKVMSHPNLKEGGYRDKFSEHFAQN